MYKNFTAMGVFNASRIPDGTRRMYTHDEDAPHEFVDITSWEYQDILRFQQLLDQVSRVDDVPYTLALKEGENDLLYVYPEGFN